LKYDYSECGGEPSECGDGVVTNNEECDGDFSDTCESLGLVELVF